MCFLYCDFGIPRKWQPWKSLSALNFDLIWGKCSKNFQSVESSFLRAIGRTQVLSGFPISKLVLTLLNVPNTHHQVKQIKICLKWQNLSSKTEGSLPMKLLTFCEFHMNDFWTASKTIWTSAELPQSGFSIIIMHLLTLQSVHKFLDKITVTVIPHPPYSPDLVVNNFFIFPKDKMALKQRIFNNRTVMQAKQQEALAKFPTVHSR